MPVPGIYATCEQVYHVRHMRITAHSLGILDQDIFVINNCNHVIN